jgi:Bacterial RNA polymerase, alpha chain C terminal domain
MNTSDKDAYRELGALYAALTVKSISSGLLPATLAKAALPTEIATSERAERTDQRINAMTLDFQQRFAGSPGEPAVRRVEELSEVFRSRVAEMESASSSTTNFIALREAAETAIAAARATYGNGPKTADLRNEIIKAIKPYLVPLSSLLPDMASTSALKEPDDAPLAVDLPDLPTQGPGPHFELTETGVIDFVPPEALDRKGNNVSRLRELHPTLRDIARELAEAFGTGNIPHAHLAARIEEYRRQIDQALDTIDFTRLYIEGVRLANAQKAAIEKVAEDELPPLKETNQEALDTLLQLHGTFILATIAGVELIAAEQRYRRRPTEEREYREAAVDFAASLQNRPDVITPTAAALVLGAAEQISQGANPERSGVVATSTVLNVAITFAAVAVVTALPVIGGVIGGSGGAIAGGLTGYMASESLKKSRPFAAVIAPIIAKLDQAAQVDFQKFKKFLLSIEQKVRRLARYNEQFVWINRALNWITPAVLTETFNMDLLRKVNSIGLSNRTLNFLGEDNIVFVGDLVQKTEAEMIRAPNCSQTIISEMQDVLASIGLHLGMELRDWPPVNIEELLTVSTIGTIQSTNPE